MYVNDIFWTRIYLETNSFYFYVCEKNYMYLTEIYMNVLLNNSNFKLCVFKEVTYFF